MSHGENPRKVRRTGDADKCRFAAIRKRFQDERPGPEKLLASADVAEFVALGQYLNLRQAVAALKQERQRKRLSLATVARRSKIDKAAISRLENGLHVNPTVDTLHRYAAAIDAEIVWTVRPSAIGRA
jgi:DNA-binding XRE family transcriptional regulator